MSAKVHDPVTPGEILLTEFLEPLGISQYRLAQATGLPQTRISEIVHGRRRITPDTGLRLSWALGLSERYWINMQTDYDIETEHDLHKEELRQVERQDAVHGPRRSGPGGGGVAAAPELVGARGRVRPS